MCLAAPSRIVSLAGGCALVECFGQRREVSLLLLAEEPRVGDYLLVQAGGFAFECMSAQEGEAALAAIVELLSQQGGDVRSWGVAA